MSNLQIYGSTTDICNTLEHLGRLPSDFDGRAILPLLTYPNENVRVLAVKTLGKIESIAYLPTLCSVVQQDLSSLVKREAVSAIGRMRSPQTIDKLIDILGDNDPKVVCQAIRGLLVFKGQKKVDDALKQLINNENEMVQSVIQREYFQKESKIQNRLAHPDTYPFLQNVVVNADVRKVLELIPDESIHLTFTSPPYYNARDYSIYPSYEAYLHFLQDVFEATYRVTKEGRFLIVNTSPVIIPRVSRSHASKRYPIPFDLHTILVKMGWEFIDDIIWMKPEYSVKNRIGGFQQHRKPLAYKPNTVTEYLMVYRKKTDKLLDWNIHQYSSAIVNESKVIGNIDTTNVWQINPKSDKVHSAVFPEELCKRVIKYYSFKGDLIFDPFGGSGTVGRVAKSMQRYFFLTELEKKYFEYMKSFQREDSLFNEKKTLFVTLEDFKKTIQL